MSLGAVRHVSDIKVDSIRPESHGQLHLMGETNKFASQKGMAIGATRHVADIQLTNMCKESNGYINLQAGKP